MKIHWQEAVLWSGLSVLIPTVSESTASGQFIPGSCPSCQLPPTQCHCMAQQPVVETQMVPRQVTVMRNEVVTQYRQEAYTHSVPVTTYRQVVVDEGHYQQVWVPKHVTKQVPQTTYQQQTAYRSVPCQVTRQVPQTVTQMVPQQVVRYQPYTFQAASPCATGNCSTCTTGIAPMISHAPFLAPSCTAPATAIRQEVGMLTPTTSGISAPSPAAAIPDVSEANGKPVPDPKFLESPGAAKETWTTVGSRNKSPAAVSSAPIAPIEQRVANESGIRFKPARTVYRAWESQSQIAGDFPDRQ